jgi:hypothetical protein
MIQKRGNQPVVQPGRVNLGRVAPRGSVLRSHVGPFGWQEREDRYEGSRNYAEQSANEAPQTLWIADAARHNGQLG